MALLTVAVTLVAALLSPSPAGGRTESLPTVRRGTAPVVTPGVSRTTIRVGLHAPLSGASPVPSDSVEKGKDLLFRWMKSGGRDIFGRDVEVVLRNDQYNPSAAVSVCKEMVEQEDVFMLIGFHGVDQIQACARYAASVGVPYVSPGVTRLVLNQLDNYFAVSMTWPSQSRLLADMFVDRLGAKQRKNGIVSTDTPNNQGAHDRFVAEMTRRGATVDYDRSVPKTAGVSEARIVVEEMKAMGIENVNVLVTPVFFIQLIAAANERDYMPVWTSVASGIASDTVTNVGCGSGDSIDGARSLSNYPAVAESDRFDAGFRNASRKFYPSKTPDDYMWQLWALDRVLVKMFRRAGDELGRQRFIRRVERTDRLFTGIGPTLRFEPNDHFGARDTHVLKADCTDRKWHTVRSFVRDF